MESCENCGRDIGNLETPHVIDDHIVCAECHEKIRASRAPAMREKSPIVVEAQRITAPPPPSRRRPQNKPQGNGAAMALGIASLIMGVIALAASWIPFIGCVAIPFGGLGILVGFIGGIMSLTTSGRGIGFPIGGVLISIIALVVMFTVTAGTTSAISSAMEEVVDEMAVARLERLEEELAELQAEQVQANKNKAIVGKVTIQRAKLIWDNQFSSTPTFELRISNSHTEPLTRIFMRGKATSPNKPLPYGEDDFNYSPAGGMAADSLDDLLLSPSFLSDWDRVPRDDPDVVFEVEVVGIETPSGEYHTRLSERKQERLAELPAEIVEARQRIEGSKKPATP